MVAVVAAYDDGVMADDVEFGVHRLVVGDAFGVVAPDNACDGLGQFYLTLVGDLEVLDGVDDGCRSYQGDAVEHTLGKYCVGYLDDAFFADFAALEVVADGDTAVEVGDAEKLDGLEERGRGYAVDDGAGTEGGHCEFFFAACHNRFRC